MELTSYFERYLSNIEPTSDQRSGASTGHTTLRERLAKHEDYASAFADSFLSGSYGRNTAIRPINDVDVIVVTWHDQDSTTPARALGRLESALEDYYTRVRRQNRSVRVSLSYVTMDVVPACTTGGGVEGKLQVPDRAASGWVNSHPRKHVAQASALNTRCDGRYVKLVKALKGWRDHRMASAVKPKSFLLECLAYCYASDHSFSSVARGIVGFHDHIISKYSAHERNYTHSPVVRDPAGTGIDVAKRWTYSDFCEFMKEVRASSAIAEAALESDDKAESVAKWRRLFGDSFPQAL